MKVAPEDQESRDGPQTIWLCGCGAWNGVNLATCRNCRRPSSESDITHQWVALSASSTPDAGTKE